MILMAAAVIFWLWFGIGSAASEGLGAMNWVLHILLPGGLFIATTLVAWRWPRIGGILLVIEGLVATTFVTRTFVQGKYSPSTFALMLLTLAMPPLASGILFFFSRRRRRMAES
jgi:hypothetical protein